jgi:arginine decarboxylase
MTGAIRCSYRRPATIDHQADPARGIRREYCEADRGQSLRAGSEEQEPHGSDADQSTYDGIAYSVEMLKQTLNNSIETLHFDEAWLPHAAFHEFYRDMHAIGKDSRSKLRSSSPRIRRTSCSHPQASQIIVQNSETRKLDLPIFQRPT